MSLVNTSSGAVQTVQADSFAILANVETAMTQYVSAAASENTDLAASTASLTSSFIMLAQKMCKEVVLLGLGQDLTSPFVSSIDTFDTFRCMELTQVFGQSNCICRCCDRFVLSVAQRTHPRIECVRCSGSVQRNYHDNTDYGQHSYDLAHFDLGRAGLDRPTAAIVASWLKCITRVHGQSM